MESTSIYAALAAVQSELKAPKGQMNTFGGYRYRSCEDILEAVKPILKAHDLLLTLSDEPKVLEGWHYIEATAKLESLDTSSGTEDEYMSQHYKIDCDKVEDRKALVVVLSMNGYTVRVGKEKRSGKSTLTYFVEYWRGDDE